MDTNSFNLLADMKNIEAEMEGIQQCDKWGVPVYLVIGDWGQKLMVMW